VGIDIGKNSFHAVGLDRRAAIVLRQKWARRLDRSAALQHAAVSGWHGSLRWRASPEPQAASLRSRCATDAREVCTRDIKGQKNDFRDAEVIAEAVQRPTVKFVATEAPISSTCKPGCTNGWSGNAPAGVPQLAAESLQR
jgi:transposase